jgi:catechol 2,3-dioxygenase-like lactoylglutathione lyase family enzyme
VGQDRPRGKEIAVVATFQLTVDCADPARLVAFWSAALGYRAQPPPPGFPGWREYYLHIGVPEEELGEGDPVDRIEDPTGAGPRIWFQPVPEGKTVKNRLHLDLLVGGGRSVALPERRQRVDAEVERLLGLGASRLRVLSEPGMDHYAVVLHDPEGNEFCVA